MPKKMASKGGPGKKYLRERGRKARQNFYLIQGEQSWFNFFSSTFLFRFLFFFSFGGGGGGQLNYFGIQGGRRGA